LLRIISLATLTIQQGKDMVQQEVKKKTRIYGTVAVLSALVLVSLIFVFGSTNLVLPPVETPAVSGMKTFSSFDELKN
jgi:hypothetical protein